MQVQEIMLPLAESVHPEDSLRDATARMKALEIDPMPVTENGRLVGVVTGAAIQQRAEQAGLGAGAVPVREVMSQATGAQTGESVEEALKHVEPVLGGNLSARIPVTDEAGNLVGLVAVDALRRHAGEEVDEGVAAVFAVESISSLADFDEDRVDYMSDESFPASDPIPPPSTLGPNETEGGSGSS
jgi:CBS domain-containing protein